MLTMFHIRPEVRLEPLQTGFVFYRSLSRIFWQRRDIGSS
jgi:hypothetical protein